MSYVLWAEAGVGLHSREDWIRSVCRALPEPPTVLTGNPEADLGRGLGDIAALQRQVPARKGDTWLLPYPVSGIKKAHLLGWSGENLQKPRRYQSITVPDKRSLQLLSAAGLEKKIRLGPDLSCLAERRIRPLAGAFRRDTVGLCLSRSPLPYQAYCKLIHYILLETPFEISIIPYDSTDYSLLLALERQFRCSGRLRLRPPGNAPELRGDISLCRMVVGMGGAIVAWSCGVPALCLGAGGRSLGLGMDLFGPWRETVVAFRELSKPDALTNRFRRFLQFEQLLRQNLTDSIPHRRKEALHFDFNPAPKAQSR